jgi:hypothetical protein
LEATSREPGPGNHRHFLWSGISLTLQQQATACCTSSFQLNLIENKIRPISPSTSLAVNGKMGCRTRAHLQSLGCVRAYIMMLLRVLVRGRPAAPAAASRPRARRPEAAASCSRVLHAEFKYEPSGALESAAATVQIKAAAGGGDIHLHLNAEPVGPPRLRGTSQASRHRVFPPLCASDTCFC